MPAPVGLSALIKRHAEPGNTLMVLLPPAEEAFFPPVDLGRAMARVADAALESVPGVRLLQDPGTMNTALANLLPRQGLARWREENARLRRQTADLGLLAEAALEGEKLMATLVLVDLSDGTRLGSVGPLPLPVPPRTASAPEVAFPMMAKELRERAVDARDVLVRPFTMGGTGVVTDAGVYIAERMGSAWQEAGGSANAWLRDAAPVRLRRNRSDGQGDTLVGTLWPYDPSRVRVTVSILRDGETLATRSEVVATVGFPARIARLLDPARTPPSEGFLPLLSARLGELDAVLSMTIAGGRGPVYRICPDPAAPDARDRCDRLEIALRADQPGHVLCFALGDDGAFGLLAPISGSAAPVLRRDHPTVLPDALPQAPGGGQYWWPAYGPPGSALVLCALYQTAEPMPVELLEPLSGEVLSPAAVLRLAQIIADSRPDAAARTVVNIVAPDTRGYLQHGNGR